MTDHSIECKYNSNFFHERINGPNVPVVLQCVAVSVEDAVGGGEDPTAVEDGTAAKFAVFWL